MERLAAVLRQQVVEDLGGLGTGDVRFGPNRAVLVAANVGHVGFLVQLRPLRRHMDGQHGVLGGVGHIGERHGAEVGVLLRLGGRGGPCHGERFGGGAVIVVGVHCGSHGHCGFAYAGIPLIGDQLPDQQIKQHFRRVAHLLEDFQNGVEIKAAVDQRFDEGFQIEILAQNLLKRFDQRLQVKLVAKRCDERLNERFCIQLAAHGTLNDLHDLGEIDVLAKDFLQRFDERFHVQLAAHGVLNGFYDLRQIDVLAERALQRLNQRGKVEFAARGILDGFHDRGNVHVRAELRLNRGDDRVQIRAAVQRGLDLLDHFRRELVAQQRLQRRQQSIHVDLHRRGRRFISGRERSGAANQLLQDRKQGRNVNITAADERAQNCSQIKLRILGELAEDLFQIEAAVLQRLENLLPVDAAVQKGVHDVVPVEAHLLQNTDDGLKIQPLLQHGAQPCLQIKITVFDLIEQVVKHGPDRECCGACLLDDGILRLTGDDRQCGGDVRQLQCVCARHAANGQAEDHNQAQKQG